MKSLIPVFVLLGIVLVLVAALLIFGEPVQHRVDRCSQRGGTYLRHEGVCVRLEQINIDK